VDVTFSGSGNTTLNHIQRRTSSQDTGIVINGPGSVTFTGFTDVGAGAGQGYITGPTRLLGGKARLNDERNLGGDPAVFNAAQLSLNGGTLAAAATFTIDDTNRGVTLGNNGGTVEVEGSHALTLVSPVTGGGALDKTGSGTLILSGANDYSGGTTVSEGALLTANALGSATGSGPFTLASAATLGGTGIIATSDSHHIHLNGIVSPGLPGVNDNVGTLNLTTMNGSVLFGAGASSLFELHSNGSNGLNLTFDEDGFIETVGGSYNGTGSDRLTFSSLGSGLLDFTSAPASSLSVIFGTGYSPMLGDAFDLLDWTAVAGLNTSLLNLPSLTAFNPNWVWDDSQFVAHGVIAITPEPGRVMLCLLGLGWALLRRRRRV
jgi:autotransporter-associated beta strand protein